MTPSDAARAARPASQRAAEVALPHAAVVTAFVAPLTVWDRLPDPVAAHWSASGPDGSLGRVADLLLLGLVTIVVAYGPLLAGRVPMPRPQAQLLVATAGAGSVLLAGIRVAAVVANLDARSWQQADGLGGTTLLLVAAAAVTAGVVGWLAARGRPDLRPPTTAAATIEVAPGEAVVWTGGASGRTPVVVSLLLLVSAAVSAVTTPPQARTLTVVVPAVLALTLAAFGQVRVTVGPRGLRASLGWFGFPRLLVPVEDVVDVTVEDVAPMSYGGWGLRHVPGATAVVVRRGPAVRVARTDGRAFVVTVDDAEVAAGVLRAHREALATSS